MKKGMCNLCDNRCMKEQVQNWEADGTTRVVPPRRVMKPFCTEYWLHLEYVEQVVEGDAPCPGFV